MTKSLSLSGLAALTATFAMTVGGFQPVAAAEPIPPFAVISVANVDRLTTDLAYLTRALGRPEASGMIQLLVGTLVDRLDRTRPSGVLATLVDSQPRGVGFLPVKDFDKLIAELRTRFTVEVDDMDNGIKHVPLGKGAYLKALGPWLFFSDRADNLLALPADPAALLAGLPQQYNLALRVFVQRIPQQLRQRATEQLRLGLESRLNGNLTPADALSREVVRQLRSQSLETVAALIQDTSEVTLGWAIDAREQRSFLEFQLTAVAGSTLERRWEGLKFEQTAFAGVLLEDAAVKANWSWRLSPDNVEQAETLVRLLREKATQAVDADPKAPAQLKEIINRFLDIIHRTVEDRTVDVAAAVKLAPKSLQFVSAVGTADGNAVGKTLQGLFELAKNEPDVPTIQCYALRHKDVDFHTFHVPIPAQERESRSVLGDKLPVVVGTGPKAVYLAFGQDCVELLKTVLDRSAQQGSQHVPAMSVQVTAKPLVQFLHSVNTEDAGLTALVEGLDQITGGDGAAFTVRAVEHGVAYRVEVQQGVLELFGKIAQQQEKK